MIFSTVGRMFFLWRRARRNPAIEHLATYCQIIMCTLIVYLVPNMFINRQDFDLMYQLVAIGAGLAAVTQRKLATQRAVETATEVTDDTVPLWQRARA
jgi:hypothetical protein